MKEKKNIDRIFQERFKDFEAHPDPSVWDGIEARLDKKHKKRRVIPIWFKVGSVAALLALLAVIADFYFRPASTDNQLVNDNKPAQIQHNSKKNEDPVLTPFVDNDTLTPPILQPKAYADNEDANVKTDTVAGAAVKPKGKFANNKKIKNDTKTETYAGTFDLRQKNKENTAGLILKDSSKTSNTNGLAQNESKKQGMNSSDSANALSNRIKDSVSLAVAKTDILKENKENTDAIVESGQHKPSDSLHAKKSIFDAIAERDEKDADENTRNDSTSLNRWALTPKVAPVYYNSFSGSGIGPPFDKSNKEGGVNLSYGLQVSYAVNDKLSLRSGVNRVDLSYNTTDVSFAPVGGRRAIASIDYVKNADILSVEGASSQSFINSPIVNPSLEIVTPTVSTGAIQQRLSYYELPLEMEYNLIDNKIGVQLIGGLSSLILKQDEILLRDEDFTTLLGSSNSLNSVSFSTNVGLGFDYNFSSMVQFNLEPMFKYQLNAFKNTVQDFKPYYLGLYTGISIRF